MKKKEKNHCCCHCFSPAGEKYFFQLKLRKVYFCSLPCQRAWEKSRNQFLEAKKNDTSKAWRNINLPKRPKSFSVIRLRMSPTVLRPISVIIWKPGWWLRMSRQVTTFWFFTLGFSFCILRVVFYFWINFELEIDLG